MQVFVVVWCFVDIYYAMRCFFLARFLSFGPVFYGIFITVLVYVLSSLLLRHSRSTVVCCYTTAVRTARKDATHHWNHPYPHSSHNSNNLVRWTILPSLHSLFIVASSTLDTTGGHHACGETLIWIDLGIAPPLAMSGVVPPLLCWRPDGALLGLILECLVLANESAAAHKVGSMETTVPVPLFPLGNDL